MEGKTQNYPAMSYPALTYHSHAIRRIRFLLKECEALKEIVMLDGDKVFSFSNEWRQVTDENELCSLIKKMEGFVKANPRGQTEIQFKEAVF